MEPLVRFVCLAFFFFTATIFCLAQHPSANEWQRLLDANKITEAKGLCTKWSKSTQLSQRVEAQKCLANVALCKGSILSLTGNDTGGGSLGNGYTPEAVNEALKHLNEGIHLAPQDLSIHQGRLHVLEVAGRFNDMAKALDDSATIYQGKDALEEWLSYAAELADMGQAHAGLEISLVLDKHYPNSHDVIGNIGAFHSMLKEPDQALSFLQKAVEIAPADPIDTWNLGHDYDKLDQIELADKWYTVAIKLDPEGKNLPGRNCLYAEFVETKLKDRDRACKLEKISCEEGRQTACAK
jgi:tetratricopeptide (TPR) repeat protein